MSIKITKKETWEMGNFRKREWKIANLEHFGKNINYNSTTYYITQLDTQKNVLGAVVCKESAGVIQVSELIVAKTNQGKGVGRQLMLKVEELTKKHHIHKIYLETGKKWRAVEFYQKLGYKITGQLPQHHFKQDFIELSKFF